MENPFMSLGSAIRSALVPSPEQRLKSRLEGMRYSDIEDVIQAVNREAIPIISRRAEIMESIARLESSSGSRKSIMRLEAEHQQLRQAHEYLLSLIATRQEAVDMSFNAMVSRLSDSIKKREPAQAAIAKSLENGLQSARLERVLAIHSLFLENPRHLESGENKQLLEMSYKFTQADHEGAKARIDPLIEKYSGAGRRKASTTRKYTTARRKPI